ncbi:RHS repeat-associated core domain-containing protein, partial [Burkholderia ubonensis]
RRTLKEAGRPDGSIDRTVFTWDGDVLLMEERFHLPPRQPGEREPLTFRPVQIVREDPDDPYALPVAQRMHTLSERHQWQGASLYLHEPGTFVPLARLDETLVEAAFIATGTDGRFVQVPAKTRHATLFYQNNHLGTPQELLDESGKVVWLGRYRAWGAEKTVWQAQPERHEAGNPIRFQGQYHDDETGLHYNRHRYYDPDTGRFISKDPIGLAGGINVYQYAPNPTGWIDPLGLTGSNVPALPALNQSDLSVPALSTTPVDPITKAPIGRVIVDGNGNAVIEPVGGSTVARSNGIDTHTLYANGSNCYRLNPKGHANNPCPHGHAHALGTGPNMKGQGASLDINGNVVPSNSAAAHIPLK